MPYFLCKLLPPRKSFAADMTAEELGLMRAHQDYWLPHVAAGAVIVMGQVADPAGVWGVAVVNAPSASVLAVWQSGDPVVAAGLGFAYENFAMPAIRVAPIEPLAPVSSVTP